MIKIKIPELDKHRNETTFRPYLNAKNELREIGIELVTGDSDSVDLFWLGQATYLDKKKRLDKNVNKVFELMSKYQRAILFDGADSHSLMGSYDMLRASRFHSNGQWIALLKNSLLSNIGEYKNTYPFGRSYWGAFGFRDYRCDDIDFIKNNIFLSGTNWLSTIPNGNNLFVENNKKIYDVSGLFSYPLESGEEFGDEHYRYYNTFRKPCYENLKQRKDISVKILENGVKLPPNEYYNVMKSSKIIVAPFGYGEIAPRDLEAAIFGSILIKPSMSHIQTEPNIYEEYVTYIPCKHDFTDLDSQIDYVLTNYNKFVYELPYNFLKKFKENYTNEKLAVYLHSLFSTKLSELFRV